MELEKKQELLRGLTKDFAITAEAIIDGSFTYHEAVSKLIVCEIRPHKSDEVTEKAVATQKRVVKCSNCRKEGHLAKQRW